MSKNQYHTYCALPACNVFSQQNYLLCVVLLFLSYSLTQLVKHVSVPVTEGKKMPTNSVKEVVMSANT